MDDLKTEDIIDIVSEGDELDIVAIYANKRGLKRFAMHLIDVAEKLDDSDSISLYDAENTTNDWLPKNVIIYNVNSPKMPVVIEEKPWAAKLKKAGNILGVLLLLLTFFVGLITIIIGAIDVIF